MHSHLTHVLYPAIIKRLDDSIEKIRLNACKTYVACGPLQRLDISCGELPFDADFYVLQNRKDYSELQWSTVQSNCWFTSMIPQ